jgi:hypothetical protein
VIQLKSGLKFMISDDHGKLAVYSTEAGFEVDGSSFVGPT